MHKNILANFIGKFWSIISNFIFIPIYISLLGMESFSIISFTLVISGLLALLDSGLTATLSRELASNQNSYSDKKRIFRTLESSYFIIVVFIIVLIFISSEFIAVKWLKLLDISSTEVAYYLKIIGFGVGFQFLAKFYIGGMLGLEQQVKANLYQIRWGVIRNGLVVLVLLFYPSLELFFIWQTSVTIIYVFLLRSSLYKFWVKERSFIFKIEREILVKVGKFARGMLLISLVAGLNSQMDRIAISKLLSIESLGFYTIASSLALSLVAITSPISNAILPRITFLYTSNKKDEGANFFLKIFKPTVILVFSFAFILSFNSRKILWAWTGNQEVVENSSDLVFVLVIATAMLAISVLPYNLAIANAYTKLNNVLGLVSLILTMPGYWIFAKTYGAFGAASVFCFVQSVITLSYVYFIKKRYLQNISHRKIFINYLLGPMVFIGLSAFILGQLPFDFENRLYIVIWLGVNLLLLLLFSFLVFFSKEEKIYYKNIFLALKFKST